FRPVNAAISDWRCTIEPDDSIRLGFGVVQSLRSELGQQIVNERQRRPFKSLEDFKRRLHLNKFELRRLAEIGALNCFAEHRREALWNAEREVPENDLFTLAIAEGSSPLLAMNAVERLRADYEGMGLTTG